MRLLAVNNKCNKTSSETEEFSIFLGHIRLQKQHSSLMYWLKICKAWVRSQLRWASNWLKLNVTSSKVLRIIIHWLLARRDVRLTQRSLISKEHSLYRALKHSICQHKLDLNLSKTKQPLPIITNSHFNFRYLTASANLNIDLRHTWLNTALQFVGKNLVRRKNSLRTCIPFDIRFYKTLNRRIAVAFRLILWF